MILKKTTKGGDISVNKLVVRGFTLIELLIVIAILGTLAVVVLVAIDPIQQLAKTRDGGRQQTVTSLGHSVESYAVGNSGALPAATTWMQDLVDSGEINNTTSAVNAQLSSYTACTSNNVNNWCYAVSGDDAIVYTTLEADASQDKCTTGTAFAVYSTRDGRGGIVCSSGQPSPGSQTFVN